MAATLSLQLDTQMSDSNPDVEIINGHAYVSDAEKSRICQINIDRSVEYRRKLKAGEIKPYRHVDIRQGGGIRKPKRQSRTPAHVPACDHALAWHQRDS